jgi:hypothetical protein
MLWCYGMYFMLKLNEIYVFLQITTPQYVMLAIEEWETIVCVSPEANN